MNTVVEYIYLDSDERRRFAARYVPYKHIIKFIRIIRFNRFVHICRVIGRTRLIKKELAISVDLKQNHYVDNNVW